MIDALYPETVATKRLPHVLSELLQVALDDLKKCEADESTYHINMHEWHVPHYFDSGKCSVCLSGAVMAQSLGVSPDVEITPGQLGSVYSDTSAKLQILDTLRVGLVEVALWMSGVKTFLVPNRDVHPYEVDSEQFHADMAQIIADLKAAGL